MHFRKGIQRSFCFLVFALWSYITLHCDILTRYCMVLRRTHKMWIFDIFRQRHLVLRECLEANQMPHYSHLVCLSLWYSLLSFFKYKSHNSRLLTCKMFTQKSCDVSVCVGYMIKYPLSRPTCYTAHFPASGAVSYLLFGFSK